MREVGLRAVSAALIACFCAGCATGSPALAPAPDQAPAAVQSALVGSLEVEVVGDTAWLTLHATNGSTLPVTLEFRSAQRHDFEVTTLAGERLWRWSDGEMFAQALAADTLAPGATLRERVAWVVSAEPGEYVAVGRLESESSPLELRARFRVSAR
jgi:hypothetical protein